MTQPANIAVVGATGNLGKEILNVLAERGFSGDGVHAFATERTAGEEVDFGEETLEVELTEDDSFRSMAAVILATPDDASKMLAPKAKAAGAWVVDLSRAYGADATIPVAARSQLGAIIRLPGRIVRVPSAVSFGLSTVLGALKSHGLESVQAWVSVPASEAGHRGVNELQTQSAALLSGRPVDPEVFPHRVAFNLVPQVEGEQFWLQDFRAINSEIDPDSISLAAVRVPLFFGHVLQIQAQLKGEANLDKLRETFKQTAGVKLLDNPQERIYPMPMLVAHDASIHVGKFQPVARHSNRVMFIAAFDHASHLAHQAVALVEGLLKPQ